MQGYSETSRKIPSPIRHNFIQNLQPERDLWMKHGHEKAGAIAGFLNSICSEYDQYFATTGPPKV
jgi:hypothetical protein